MFKKKRTKKEVHVFPRDLKELGYCIDEEGQLKTIVGGEPYKFEVREKDKAYNEALYDAILETIGDWVQDTLQKKFGMVRALLPIGVTESDVHTKIYVSPDYLTNEKMMIFIPGTSHTIGIWSRRVLADKSVVEGSMIAYTQRAIEMGFSVVITNPNEVFWYKDKGVLILPKSTSEFSTIPGSESPENHIKYVFENFVIPSGAQKIVIVANSYGGHCAIDIVQNKFDALKDRVKAIEFTASTHSIDYVMTDKMRVWVREHCRNWLMSDQEAGKEVIDVRFGCTSLSSGAELNEFVTTDVIDDVFSFIERRVVNEEFWEISDNENEDDYLEETKIIELDNELMNEIGDVREIRDIQEKVRPELEESPDSEWLK
ncbi:hypothetical protein RhiirA5_347698 [Rhizophagus irregularis]|uniref:Arb2 domain-containing protein n=4 Tax=Rhizophagus irregularis TaxID=588596 RepID=A0A2I1F2Y8_9GLOM|nr:hypothetical protein GLOIN_2v1497166 [Rhizophagus irregularis DAOM 181602=DAOM 197198]PKC16445.1 hypothetical protein RhiirA5_347698 [Rhizophagus irregularis]PKC67652.1 hypothetical protein RhiirA1_509080 [Rhizophagus irregularis]PKY28739.1 hypothetical protein RhiirB3_481897 [Rhizophagus irregularis]POG82672.1 hypothetical protein GLOIN_2v1497166 [Rhizophagus irregularis DAOM 181602=DAOM 197198]UZO19390.1 hypothetical protein OCT59_010687 [Rhizophagus irregularis]|eukprot:XP_025189538.1 hypothetical protein GLOIN_2v1497166 [Rhizophagus irregularis DAOM 181602=DAOM 197198]